MRVIFTNGPIGHDETSVEFSGSVAELRALVAALASSSEESLKKEHDEEYLMMLQSPGGLIPAIKLYRSRTGAALKDAKDYIEALRDAVYPSRVP